MAPQLEQLFSAHRFQDRAPVLFLLLMAYFPIGIALMVLRILISFQYVLLLAILPKGFFLRQFIMRIHLFLVGILVTSDGKENKKDNAQLVVSNYISYLDSIAIEAIFPTQRLGKQTNLPSLFKWLLGFIEDDSSCIGLEAFDYEYPVSVFPEEDTTSGRVGLLKFQKSFFAKTGLIVQPLVISSYRPRFFPVNIHCLSSSFWSDFLWTLFFPCTKFHVSYLVDREIHPVEENGEEEDNTAAFVKELENDIANMLSIEATVFTAKDKSDYIKRLAYEQRMKEQAELRPKVAVTRETNNKYIEMAKQVKFVLPQVPMNVVEGEIKRTKNVDRAISNFLDGSIKYNPLSEEQQQKEKEMLMNKKKEIASRSVSNSQFSGMTSKDRHLSFQEKKELMIQEARVKYLQQHPEYA